MIRALAVIVPGNDVAAGKRKNTRLNVAARHDGFDVLYGVVRHVGAFTSRSLSLRPSQSRPSRLMPL